jgi:hypothetical protein
MGIDAGNERAAARQAAPAAAHAPAAAQVPRCLAPRRAAERLGAGGVAASRGKAPRHACGRRCPCWPPRRHARPAHRVGLGMQRPPANSWRTTPAVAACKRRFAAGQPRERTASVCVCVWGGGGTNLRLPPRPQHSSSPPLPRGCACGLTFDGLQAGTTVQLGGVQLQQLRRVCGQQERLALLAQGSVFLVGSHRWAQLQLGRAVAGRRRVILRTALPGTSLQLTGSSAGHSAPAPARTYVINNRPC